MLGLTRSMEKVETEEEKRRKEVQMKEAAREAAREALRQTREDRLERERAESSVGREVPTDGEGGNGEVEGDGILMVMTAGATILRVICVSMICIRDFLCFIHISVICIRDFLFFIHISMICIQSHLSLKVDFLLNYDDITGNTWWYIMYRSQNFPTQSLAVKIDRSYLLPLINIDHELVPLRV